MPIPDADKSVAEVVLKGNAAAGGSNVIPTVNIFHYRRTSTINPLSKADLDTVFQAGPVDALGDALNNRWLQSMNSIRMIDDATDMYTDFAHAKAGQVAGDGLSSILAVYILLRTALRGKNYRGSKHFGPLSEADATAGGDDVLNAAAITRWNAVATALATPLVDASGNTWNLCVLSRSLSTLNTNPTLVIANDVATVALNKRIGRLRNREVASVY